MEWKKPEFLSVSGNMAYPGTFRGTSGKVTSFTKDFIKTLFARFTDSIPLHLTHSERGIVGFITGLGYDEATDTIHYDGVIFNSDTKKYIEEQGFNSISPEISVLKGDEEEPLEGVISGAAFVRVPAIPNTITAYNTISFSAYDGDITPEMATVLPASSPSNEERDEVMTENPIKQPDEGIKLHASAVNMAEVELAKRQIEDRLKSYESQINTLSGDLNTFKSKAEELEVRSTEYKSKYENLLKAEIAKAESELAELGIDKPSEFANSLDVESRLEVLKSAKTHLLKTGKLHKPPEGKLEAAPKPEDNKVERAKQMGISEEYLRYIR